MGYLKSFFQKGLFKNNLVYEKHEGNTDVNGMLWSNFCESSIDHNKSVIAMFLPIL